MVELYNNSYTFCENTVIVLMQNLFATSVSDILRTSVSVPGSPNAGLICKNEPTKGRDEKLKLSLVKGGQGFFSKY